MLAASEDSSDVFLCPPQVGFINSLKFSSAGDFLVAGVGQEHRCVVGARLRAGWHWPDGTRRGLEGGVGSASAAALIPHRLGRWWRIKEARNSVCIIPLRRVPAAPVAGS